LIDIVQHREQRNRYNHSEEAEQTAEQQQRKSYPKLADAGFCADNLGFL
jgi:hypothetical protein